MGKPEPIASVIARQLAQVGIAKQVKQASVEHLWPEVLGPVVAQHTKITRNDMGRLDTPEWRQELLYRRESIIEILNQRLGDELVTDIMFTGP